MKSSSSSIITAVMLWIILQIAVSAQTQQQPVTANLCEVVASPDGYTNKPITLEGILFPGDHSLALYSPSCKPTEKSDVSIQAVLPTGWETLANGRQLRKFLKTGMAASVKVTGVFESGTHRYGPDVARFRFTVTAISLVEKAPLNFHL